jgi:hypothetical protein
MTRKAGEEVIIVGMKGGEAFNGRKAIWLNFDRERNKHRIKVFVNAGLDDEILLVKGENITSDKKFLKEHPEYDTPHKRKRLGTLDEVLKENEEKKKKKEKGQKKLIENPFVKEDGKIVEKPKTKRETVKKRGWTPGSYARARAQAAREGGGGRFARRDEEEDEHEGGEEEEEDFFYDERTVDRKVAVMRQKLLAMNMQLNARFSSDDLKDALVKTRGNVDGAIDALLESKRRTDEEEDERERRKKRERTTTDVGKEVIVLN